MHRIVIVGGGIAGLAAAWELIRSGIPGPDVVVLEGSDRVGGKLRQERIAGHLVDVGAESMLAVRPEAPGLIREIGAGDLLVAPATTSASIYSYGELHPLPPGSLLGIPRRVEDAAGILSPAELDRLREVRVPPLDGDVSVGAYVAAALGDAVVDRLVDPLLGGVYAGRARDLSLAAAAPQVHAKALAGEPLLSPGESGSVSGAGLPPRSGGIATHGSRKPAPVAETPHTSDESGIAADGAALPPRSVFAGLEGGVGRLPVLLAGALRARGVRIETGVMVRALTRRADGAGWDLIAGPTIAALRIPAEAVVLATPPAATRRLLSAAEPAAASLLHGIETASMVVVTIALPADTPAAPLPPGSGFLVPAVEGRAIKAATFSSAKWGHLARAAPGVTYLRASLGRHGDEGALQRPDAELVGAVLRDLGDILGAPLPTPIETHVQRWGGALPQYAVGHLDRIALLQAAIAEVPGLELAGATYAGVGIPAVIGTGRAAARAVVAELARRG